jgi:cytochrome c peroxidase
MTQSQNAATPAQHAAAAVPPSRIPRPLRWGVLAAALAAAGFCLWAVASPEYAPPAVANPVEQQSGANPRPVHLRRPSAAPLSAVALLGKQIFFDPSLSASRQLSCASCHSPQQAYGPSNQLSVQLGGPSLTQEGNRPPPSLVYLYRQPSFSIGPDDGEAEDGVNLTQAAAQSANVAPEQKTAGAAPAAPAMVPQGGMFWDGRADTLQAQAYGPLLNPTEMANATIGDVAAKLNRTAYRDAFIQLFGRNIFDDSKLLLSEAMFAVSRYQVEDPSFHPYTSKYDYWLEGKARLSQAELRGLRLFNDPNGANCAGCHLSKPGRDGLPPLFTDFQYEALGVPRNMHIRANRKPGYFDMGLCGPYRSDLATQTQYCGMFLTPTLRNAANRKVFFHNGIYRSLDEVLAFYNLRDVDPGKIYPHDGRGKIEQYNDLPARYRANVDVTDAPLNRKLGDAPAMSAQDIRDIIAFLKTLTDGYRPD